MRRLTPGAKGRTEERRKEEEKGRKQMRKERGRSWDFGLQEASTAGVEAGRRTARERRELT